MIPTTSSPVQRPSTIAELFDVALKLALRHYLALFATAALVLVPTMTIVAAVGSASGTGINLATSAVSLAALLLIEAPLTLACVRALGMMREPSGIQPSLIHQATLERIGGVLVVIALSRVVPIPFFAVLVGCFLYLRFFVALPAMLAEHIGPIAALGRSYELTGQSIVESILVVLATLVMGGGLVLVEGFISLILVPAMLLMAPLISFLPGRAMYVVTSVLSAALSAGMWSAALPFLAALSAALYREMRVREVLAAPATQLAPADASGGGPFRSPMVDPMATVAPWPLDGAGAPGAAFARAPASDGGVVATRIKQVIAFAIAAAVGVAGYWGVSRYRHERALHRASLCVAQGDADCARDALGALRSGGEDVRFRIAEADAALLAGERRPAENLLRTISPEQGEYAFGGAREPMRREVRADLMILRGDLALSRKQMEDAKRDLWAARLLVRETDLVDVRLARNGLAPAQPGASVAPPPRVSEAPPDSATVADLRTDYLKLLDLAPGGETADALALMKGLEQRVSQIGNPSARSRLTLTLGAIRDAIQQAKYNQLMEQPDQAPKRPSPPSIDDIPPSARTPRSIDRERQRLWKKYEVELARYNEALDRRFDVKTKDEQKLQWKLQEAKRILNENFIALESGTP